MKILSNPPAMLLSGLLFAAGAITAAVFIHDGAVIGYTVPALLIVLAILTPMSLMMANQWEKVVILRFGKLHAMRGAGMFMIVPFIDAIAAVIDQRIQTIEFNAEQALTRDTVPANIDAVLFWQVHDAEKAALEITDYRQAISRVAQTTLREAIGASPLSELLANRKEMDEMLTAEIGRKSADWGVSAISVEIRDVSIPSALQDAMSRQAQAEREKQARVILGSAEEEIAQKFLAAAQVYERNAAALQLRAMNIVYETTKERGATVLIPSAMIDAMNPGGILGIAGFSKPAVQGG